MVFSTLVASTSAEKCWGHCLHTQRMAVNQGPGISKGVLVH